VALKDFVEKYPNNENVVEATYLIGDAADQIQDTLTAIPFFKKVIEKMSTRK